METILVDKKVIEEYKKMRPGVTGISDKIICIDLNNDNFPSNINNIGGIVSRDGKLYRMDGLLPNHEFICFVLEKNKIDLNQALRICEVNRSGVHEIIVGCAKFNTQTSLTPKEIQGIHNLLKQKSFENWESLIMKGKVFDLGFEKNEDHALGVRNLSYLREILGSQFDYEMCLNYIKQANLFNKPRK